ncbi:Uncharacterized protein BWINRASL_03540 [Bacillus mycoides]|nr:Uncharacterized protein BWINRASL_03540 [Bacillus mycoides]
MSSKNRTHFNHCHIPCAFPVPIPTPEPTDPVHPGFHVSQKCFIDTHPYNGTFIVGTGVINQTVIEDLTCDHNQTLLVLKSVDPNQVSQDVAQPLEIRIYTKCCDRPITAVIPPEITKVFPVENFERLDVSNIGNDEGALAVSMEKTFCICCEEENINKKKCHSCDPKLSSCCNHNQKGECFIGVHVIPTFDVGLTPSSNQTVFEEFTCNHNKTLLELRATSQPISVTIKRRKCDTPLTIKIDPLPTFRDSLQRVIQVEDLESVSVLNLSATGNATFSLSARKTFCICCDHEDNDRKCGSCCVKCNGCDDKNKCHTCNRCKKCSCSCNSKN